MKRHLTTGDVAKITGFSQQTIIRCCDKNDLRSFRVPLSKFRRITPAWVKEWAAKHGLELDWGQLDTNTGDGDDGR